MASSTHLPALVIGCGYLGRRVANVWRASRPVAALTRSRAEELQRDGLQPIVGDVLDANSLMNLPLASTVLYAVGLDRSAGRSMREVYVNGLANVVRQVRCTGPFIYISSTSVYGQRDGSWVDESSLTEPLEESGRVVLEAERTLRSLRPDAIVLRFGGIYGPNRVLRRQALLAGEPLTIDAEKWLNLIHVSDGVTAVLAACERGEAGATYNVCDDEPVTRRAFYTESAIVLQAPPAMFAYQAMTIASEANRRVRNRRLCEQLGWRPHHASYRDGLRACEVG
jgi:nucleoside-diphosphate-sugar epimerase